MNEPKLERATAGAHLESDESLRTRIADAYGRWGAFLSITMESSGTALDDCAKHVKLERRGRHSLKERVIRFFSGRSTRLT